ncbi:MAG: hypothetical protein ABIZ36_06340 [Gemmatimonadaceae bacterium]
MRIVAGGAAQGEACRDRLGTADAEDLFQLLPNQLYSRDVCRTLHYPTRKQGLYLAIVLAERNQPQDK